MKHGTYQHWHYWTNTQGNLMLSDESTKELRQYNNIDEAVTATWFENKELARAINKLKG